MRTSARGNSVYKCVYSMLRVLLTDHSFYLIPPCPSVPSSSLLALATVLVGLAIVAHASRLELTRRDMLLGTGAATA